MTGATRQWFVNADLWLAGTAAAAVGEAGGLADAQVCYKYAHGHTFTKKLSCEHQELKHACA